jgi:hypothetical protein
MRRKLAYLLASLFIVLIAAMVCLRRPNLRLEGSEHSVLVHVETLGEYPTTIRRIQLQSVASGDVVFEVVSGTGTPQIQNFRLLAGANPVNVVDPQYGAYRVVRPTGANSFILRQGEEYRLTIWGNGWLPARVDLQIR